MMKRTILLIAAILVSFQVFSQARVLEWSVGEPQITCGTTVQLCYPLMVSIDDGSQSPILGTSTMRFFYDSNLLENVSIQNLATGYTESGFNQSASVFGGVFGFSSTDGIFAQFNIIDGAASSPLALSGTAVHVLDICFDLKAGSTYPLCAPIVLDNNHLGKGNGIAEDDGYLQNDAGVVGTYLLNGDLTNAILADDEVVHYQWIDNGGAFDGTANELSDRTGDTDTTNCLADTCLPSLTISKTQVSGQDPITSPGPLGYEIVVTNDGNIALTGVTASDVLPDGSNGTLSAATESGTADGILSVGETFTYTISYAVSQSDIDNNTSLTNTASVVTNELPTAESDTAETPITKTPSLTISKTQVSGQDPITSPGPLGYEIVVTNDGNIALTGVTASDVLPDGSNGTLSAATESGTADGILSVGETFTYTISYAVSQS
ncbi:hypothetical protein, partial [Algibacter sp. 2305UL17-15]|uniref:DUF7507 domain-containing protein n=1 Tax=Algibacter sp. 2305UL17-15 TaxID=3231268 RepID=UPI003459D7C2